MAKRQPQLPPDVSLSREAPTHESLDPLRTMLSVLDRASLAEVGRAMGLALQPPVTPKEKRLGELGFLASLVNAVPVPTHLTFALVERYVYDELRPESAPLSARLVERYGSWRRACYHAYGLLPDGRWRGPGSPWPMHLRGHSMPADYERREIPAAIRECAFALGVRPSSSTFFRWSTAKRARALERGLSLRLPTHRSLYRHYPADQGGYNAALADANVLDDELDEAWHTRLGVSDPDALTPDDYIRAMSIEEFDAAGVSTANARRLKQRSRRKPIPKAAPGRAFSASDVTAGLPLSEALRLAAWIGCSLEWLAGVTSKIGAPPEPSLVTAARLDGEFVRTRRAELGLAEAAVRKALGLQLGPYRRLMNGQREPTIEELAALAQIGGTTITTLLGVAERPAARAVGSRTDGCLTSGE